MIMEEVNGANPTHMMNHGSMAVHYLAVLLIPKVNYLVSVQQI